MSVAVYTRFSPKMLDSNKIIGIKIPSDLVGLYLSNSQMWEWNSLRDAIWNNSERTKIFITEVPTTNLIQIGTSFRIFEFLKIFDSYYYIDLNKNKLYRDSQNIITYYFVTNNLSTAIGLLTLKVM